MSIYRAAQTTKSGSHPLIYTEHENNLERFPSHDREANLPSKLSAGQYSTENSYYNTIAVGGSQTPFHLDSQQKNPTDHPKAPLHGVGTYYANYLKDSAPLRHASNSPSYHPNSADPSKFATVQHDRLIEPNRFDTHSVTEGARVKTELNSRPPSISFLSHGYKTNIPPNPASLKNRLIMQSQNDRQKSLTA